MKAILFLFILITSVSLAQQNDPWKKEQILPTKDLATTINTNKNIPVILNVGPMDNIKTSIKVGEVNTPEGIEKLKTSVASIPKNKEIVIYCGCCSYANCVNIRPAFKTLQELGYKNIKVLDIPEGYREDWVAKGYPVE